MYSNRANQKDSHLSLCIQLIGNTLFEGLLITRYMGLLL